MTGVTGLGRFERGTIVVGDGAVIVVHGDATGTMMKTTVMMVFVLVLVVVVACVPHQCVTMHMEMVAARVRVEDEPRAGHGDARDKEENYRGRETADPDAPPLHDAWPLPHPGRNGHVVHALPYVRGPLMDWLKAGPAHGLGVLVGVPLRVAVGVGVRVALGARVGVGIGAM